MSQGKPKCLLIAPTKYYYYYFSGVTLLKYSLLSIMSQICSYAHVKIIDFERMFGFPASDKEIETFLSKVKRHFKLLDYKPDFIGISCYTSFDYLSTIDLLQLVHEIFPDAITVVGGNHPTALPDDFINEDIQVNYIVRGEGENAFEQIIRNGKKSDTNKIVVGTPLDYRDEKTLRFDLYPYKFNFGALLTSRGCIYKCGFCEQSLNTDKYRMNTIDQVEEKIRNINNFTDPQRVVLYDAFFSYNKKRTNEIIDLLLKYYRDKEIVLGTRIDCVDEEWFKKLSKRKFKFRMGLESLAEDTINLMYKKGNAESYLQKFQNTLELSQKYEVNCKFDLIMNYPGESLESYKKTIGRLKQYIEKYDNLNFSFEFNPYVLFPGNRLYRDKDKISEKSGYKYHNNGWWRIKTTNLMERSSDSLSSYSIKKEYGQNPKFWYKDAYELKTLVLNKFNTRIYFDNMDDIVETTIKKYLNEYYLDNSLDRLFPFIVHAYLEKLKPVYSELEKLLRDNNPGRGNDILMLFINKALDNSAGFLNMAKLNTDKTTILEHIENSCEDLRQEFCSFEMN